MFFLSQGQITLVKSLDYEARKEHVFTVIAGDSPRTDDIAHESSVQVSLNELITIQKGLQKWLNCKENEITSATKR